MIDLTKPKRVYDVTTRVTHGGEPSMGPVVRVNARDAEHAKQVAREAGHTPNEYFPPERKGTLEW